MDTYEMIQYAIEHTEVVRGPKRSLATFGTTNVYYYVIARPVYTGLFDADTSETVVREGRVIAERPKIVTPYYLVNLFEGFEHGKEYARRVIQEYGLYETGLLYQYKNEPREVNIVSEPVDTVAHRLVAEITKTGDPLAAVIKGVDEMWDVSLMKFIHDLTRGSLRTNIIEMGRRGLLDIDRFGVPQDAREKIEELFEQVLRGESEPAELKVELDRWGLFEEYEDRFFTLFKRG